MKRAVTLMIEDTKGEEEVAGLSPKRYKIKGKAAPTTVPHKTMMAIAKQIVAAKRSQLGLFGLCLPP